jgi:polyvinyl alcohol dehydrogenase (cytochrome)
MKKNLIPLVLIVLSCTSISTVPSAERSPARVGQDWPQWSGDIHNNHNLTTENPLLNRTNVKNLKVKWSTDSGSSVVSTPTFKKEVLYFNEISKIGVGGLFKGGNLHAVNAQDGKEIWSHKVQDYTGHSIRDFSRSSPAISGDMLFIGDSVNNLKFIAHSTIGFKGLPGSTMMGINRLTGKLLWKTEVETHFASRITMSPIVIGDKVIVGVSSMESEIPAVKGPFYKCCNFRGSVVALSATSGKILWKTRTIDDSLTDFSGAPVWGSSPPVDEKRNRIYVGSGNNYHNPKELIVCYQEVMKKENLPSSEAIKKCAKEKDSPKNRFDSIIALDITSGKIIWTKKTSIQDAWNVGCGSPFNHKFPIRTERICPNPEGLDSDFAQAPMFIPAEKNELGFDILAVGQKNGVFWVIEAESGKTVWTRQVGPGGKLGGHQWGSATDGKKIYYQTTNLEHKLVKLDAGYSKGKAVNGGFWGAVDIKTGSDVWQTPDPSSEFPLKGEGINHIIYGKNLGRGFFASAMGPLTFYNQMLFVGSVSGEMLALDSSDGKILWSFMAKGSVVGAPSVVNDTLYWGTGYHMGLEGNKVYAFGL